MRLVTYTFRGTTRLGALVGDAEVVDLNRACALHRAERGERRARALADFLLPPDMAALLPAGGPAPGAPRAAPAPRPGHGPAPRGGAVAGGPPLPPPRPRLPPPGPGAP